MNAGLEKRASFNIFHTCADIGRQSFGSLRREVGWLDCTCRDRDPVDRIELFEMREAREEEEEEFPFTCLAFTARDSFQAVAEATVNGFRCATVATVEYTTRRRRDRRCYNRQD